MTDISIKLEELGKSRAFFLTRQTSPILRIASSIQRLIATLALTTNDLLIELKFNVGYDRKISGTGLTYVSEILFLL
jgi:hypothetical protein